MLVIVSISGISSSMAVNKQFVAIREYLSFIDGNTGKSMVPPGFPNETFTSCGIFTLLENKLNNDHSATILLRIKNWANNYYNQILKSVLTII